MTITIHFNMHWSIPPQQQENPKHVSGVQNPILDERSATEGIRPTPNTNLLQEKAIIQ